MSIRGIMPEYMYYSSTCTCTSLYMYMYYSSTCTCTSLYMYRHTVWPYCEKRPSRVSIGPNEGLRLGLILAVRHIEVELGALHVWHEGIMWPSCDIWLTWSRKHCAMAWWECLAFFSKLWNVLKQKVIWGKRDKQECYSFLNWWFIIEPQECLLSVELVNCCNIAKYHSLLALQCLWETGAILNFL